MRFIREGGIHERVPPERRRVVLGYCLNLHPAETLDEVRHALETYVVPQARRSAAQGPGAQGSGSRYPGEASFGVGMYLASSAASELARDASARADLAALLRDACIDPFTFNAFPYGGFQEDGLKERVYAPNWTTAERLEFTVDVARVAAELAGPRPGGHVSISTHPGAYGADVNDRSTLRRCAEQFARAVGELVRIEAEGGPRIVLSLEAEPDGSSRNSRALAEFLIFARLVGSRILQDEFGASLAESGAHMRRHLGTCLDCCHSAVEFESVGESLECSTTGDGPLGKIQFSSALRLENPGTAQREREALLALDEPRFLHQVTSIAGPPRDGFEHLPDLPALRAALDAEERAWLEADEWRCHFHVPVDLKEAAGLGTTRTHADEILKAALADERAWTSDELHVEIETYTWSVLPGGAPLSESEIEAGLASEYDHVIARLNDAGWTRDVRA